jgi:hypothetical protein
VIFCDDRGRKAASIAGSIPTGLVAPRAVAFRFSCSARRCAWPQAAPSACAPPRLAGTVALVAVTGVAPQPAVVATLAALEVGASHCGLALDAVAFILPVALKPPLAAGCG